MPCLGKFALWNALSFFFTAKCFKNRGKILVLKKNVKFLEFFGFTMRFRIFQATKNSTFFLTRLIEKFWPITNSPCFFSLFIEDPSEPLGWPWGHEFQLLGAIGVLWHPLWAGFVTALRFFRLAGQMAGHPSSCQNSVVITVLSLFWENGLARYLAFEELLHFGVLLGNLGSL